MANLFVISAPSGAGKTSLINALLSSFDNVVLSISHTTRAKRAKEKDGLNYHFVSPADFNALIKAQAFLEYARVFDYYYGTSKELVTTQLAQQQDVILEIDWQGYEQIKRQFQQAIAIFILPPSLEILRKRLNYRGEDDKATIDKRMKMAQNEIAHYKQYDYLLVNRDFDSSLAKLKTIISAQRLKLENQEKKHDDLIKQLLKRYNN